MPATGPGPFVGRAALSDTVIGLLVEGRGAVLRGPAGIGKTRLAAEVLDRPELADRWTDRLMASPVTSGRSLGTVAPLLPPGATELALPDIYACLLDHWERRASSTGPAVVWLDDVQHVDALSAWIIRTAVCAEAVQLVATHRTPSALPAELSGLSGEGLTVDVDLAPLSREDTLRLARLSVDQFLSGTQCARVVELSAGNPLFTRELARVVTAADEDSAWRDLESLVGDQVQRLGRSERRVIELVAAAEPVPVTLFGSDTEEVAQLLRVGLLQHQGTAHLRVDHPARSAWILHRLGPLVREVHRELLDRARRLDMLDDLDPQTVMDWHLSARQRPAQELAIVATRLAISRSDPEQARRLTALVDGPVRELLDGQALICAGDVRAGLAALDRVRRTSRGGVMVEACAWQVRYLVAASRDGVEAQRLLEEVDERGLDARQRRLLWSARCWLWIFSVVPRAAELDQIPEIALSDPIEPASHDLLAAGLALATQTMPPEGYRGMLTSLARVEDEVDVGVSARARACAVRAWALMSQGRAGDAAVESSRGLEDALRHADGESASMIGGVGAFHVAVSGRVTEACAMTRSALAVPDTGGFVGYRDLALLVLRGNLALACVPDADEERLRPVAGGEDRMSGYAELLATRTAALSREGSEDAGAPDGSAGLLQALHANRRHQNNLLAVLVAGELIDVRDRSELHGEVLEAAGGATGSGLMAATGRLCRARLDRDPHRLLEAALELEGMGVVVAATRAFGDVIRTSGGDPDLGCVARRGLVRLGERWDGGRWWWLDDVADVPTSRQVEVARLVVETGSVQQVADDLVLSRRTVENHLYRVTQSLGVSGRDGLEEALRWQGED